MYGKKIHKKYLAFFFSSQLDKLRSLKMNSSMQLEDNFREIQSLGKQRVLKMSFTATDLTPTEPGSGGIALEISNVILLLTLFGVLFSR